MAVLGTFGGHPHLSRGGANKRSVWHLSTRSYPGSHFATFPPALVEPMILAGTSQHGACAECGAPYERVVERVNDSNWQLRKANGAGAGSLTNGHNASHGAGVDHDLPVRQVATLDWQPTCACGAPDGWQDGDHEIISSPTGEMTGEDPTLTIGRAGWNRPRGENEGQRPITRYEQRHYAEQLKTSPYRTQMEAEAGRSAFEHYVRTDKSGARPVPHDLLDAWIERGWLVRVAVPAWQPAETVPCTVLDPFVGSGTTIKVALQHKRRAIGVDISNTYLDELVPERIAGIAQELSGEFRTITDDNTNTSDLPLFAAAD